MEKIRENNRKNKIMSGYTTKQKNTIYVVVITSFITTFMGSALNLSIPALEENFGVSAQTVGWVVTVYMLTCAALAVPFGRASDRVERRTILWIGILIFTVSSAAAIISWEMWVLLVFRFVQGVGASMIFSTNIAMLVGAFDDKERGKVLGYATCANYVGLSVGPVLGGVLNYNLGWKSIFLTTACISAFAFYRAFFKLPKEERGNNLSKDISGQGKADFDVLGNILFVTSIVFSMYGLSAFKTNSFAPYILAAGVVLAILFVRTELNAKNPVIKVEIFKNNISYTLSNLAALINYGANYAASYMLSIYLQMIQGFTSQSAGFVLITNTVVMAVLSPVFGRLSDKLTPNLISSIGMGLCAGALGFLTFLPADSSLIRIIVILVISGLGFAMFGSPNSNAVMSCVDKKDYGVASSILATMRSIGHTSSMAIVTAIIGIYMGGSSLSESSPELLLKTIHTVFMVFTILCILGIFMAIKRKV